MKDFKWLEGHITDAAAEVATWPQWKSQSSTLELERQPDMKDEMTSTSERLRERLKLKYMGDCKCGHCALVPDNLVREAADEIERAAGYAQRLATSLWEQHWKADAPDWKPLPDLLGVLTQIDNMTAGLERKALTGREGQ